VLPANLEALRLFLQSQTRRSPVQNALLDELSNVSTTLDEVTTIRKSLTENLRKGPSMWGGDPGRCYVCGR
jgi:hypothetical protein